jgi:hypothetical protein
VALVDIGQMVLEVMSWVPGFVKAFTAASGGKSRLADLDITIAAALTAQALNVGYSPGVPALTRARISHVDQTYLRGENHAAANGPLGEAQADIALAQPGRWVGRRRGWHPFRRAGAQHRRQAQPEVLGRRRGATWLNLVNAASSAALPPLIRRSGGRRQP